MEVDEIQRQVSKFQRVSSNGSTTSTDNSSNPQKIGTNRGNLELHNRVDDGGGGSGAAAATGGGGGIDVVLGGGVGRLCGWPSSRIVRVSRASGGKDRHSKVLTSKGLRDRRVRLSVSTAIQFYDLQDRLGYDQPSKAVEWLLKAASSSIDELPSLDPPFPGAIAEMSREKTQHQPGNNSNNINDNDNNVSQVKSPACSSTSETTGGGTGGESYNLNFGMTSSTTGAPGGFSRGTLQSNSPASLLQHHHHHLQRFQSSSIGGSTSTNLPFYIVPNTTVDHYPATGGYYGGDCELHQSLEMKMEK
ncbi:hypothetical protein L1987_57132 [Smallanthus sonchifolius]|uniref:Uncharacterized protein n=1 Tax=Smallanthus sonchifolius TaxID=185202 RepID=A0ACB9DBY1_9ASTR|nr:hypothetical protein L1987_57132 [Smallanthus sonchifolius]